MVDVITSILSPELIQLDLKRPTFFDHIDEIQSDYRSHFSEGDVSFIDPWQVFLELACFVSSVGYSFAMLKTKKVLCIGSNYGMEVLLFRALSIEAYGAEIDPEMHLRSEILCEIANKHGIIIPNEAYILQDVLQIQEKYDIVLARNLNPLVEFVNILHHTQTVIEEFGILQWDALFHEEQALDLYDPRHHIQYNEVLRTLLDTLFINVLKIKKTRARFLYTITADSYTKSA